MGIEVLTEEDIGEGAEEAAIVVEEEGEAVTVGDVVTLREKRRPTVSPSSSRPMWY